MITVTREFADRVAEVAQLFEADEIPDDTLRRLTALAAELVPGGTAAAVMVAMPGTGLTFAASDQRLEELHRLQFDSDDGPVTETLRHNEPRRVDDTGAERRWPAFCRAAAEAGFASCLVLPLRTDRQPAGAIALYGPEPGVFVGAAHDVTLLVAAQGGAAVHNAALYRTCRRMLDNLHAGLESRAVIEQAKGVLHAELGVSPEEGFRLLSRYSQNTNQRVRRIAAGLVEGRVTAAQLGAAGQRPSPRLQRCALVPLHQRFAVRAARRVQPLVPGHRIAGRQSREDGELGGQQRIGVPHHLADAAQPPPLLQG
jgi:GAF domain-containing protein